MPLPSLLLTVEFGCPVFCGHTASTRSSYKISRVGSSRAHCSPRGVPGRCGWDERALQVSGGLSGLEGGGRDEDAPIATLTAGVAAVRCARCPAGRLLPCPARRPSSGATPRRDPILRSAAGCSTTPASSHLLATRVSWAAPRSAFKVSRGACLGGCSGPVSGSSDSGPKLVPVV